MIFKNSQQNENKTSFGLLTQRSSSLNRQPEMPRVPIDRCPQHFSALSGGDSSLLLWNVQEMKAPRPPIHKIPGREPPALLYAPWPASAPCLAPLPLCSHLPPQGCPQAANCDEPQGPCSACCLSPVTVVP